jgi:hypothetical protein
MEVDKNIFKRHQLYGLDGWIVSTIRHPYNAIISAILRLDKEINLESLKKHTIEFLGEGGRQFLKLDPNHPKIIILKYEDFVDDYSYIGKSIGEKMGDDWTDVDLQKIEEELSIDKMLEVQSKYNDFFGWDKETHIHGNHISKYRGKTNWEEILTPPQVQFLQEWDELNQIIQKYYS